MRPVVVAHPRMSVFEAEEHLRAIGRLRPLHDFNYFQDYAKDEHFRGVILVSLRTMRDIEQFLGELDRDNIDLTRRDVFSWGCSKTRTARPELMTGIKDWRNDWYDPHHFELAILARVRRVCCSCHEVGSFARRDELPATHQETLRRRATA